MSVNKGRSYVYYLRYHIVFCTKYRHKIIEGPIEIRLKEMFQSPANFPQIGDCYYVSNAGPCTLVGGLHPPALYP